MVPPSSSVVSATTSETASRVSSTAGPYANAAIPPQPQQPMTVNPLDALMAQMRVMEARILERLTFLERRVANVEGAVEELRREVQPQSEAASIEQPVQPPVMSR